MAKSNWFDKRVEQLVRRKVARRLELAGEFVAGAAKLNCPVDTGRLRDSIDWKVDKSELTATIGTNVEYAPYIEFGTGEGGSRRGGFSALSGGAKITGRNNRAQPFLRPALYENSRAIRSIINGR